MQYPMKPYDTVYYDKILQIPWKQQVEDVDQIMNQ